MALPAGTELNGLQVLRPVGAGGMGEVYLARDRQLHRSVAIKVLRSDITAEPRRVARLEQEARAASALSHPNICHIYHLGETPGGQRYIAMEFVEGETLHDRLAAGPLSMSDALDIAVQIAAALTAAHAAGIVHRDIKPANVVIRRDRLVKVLDFGLAKLVGPALPLGAHDQTQTGASEAGVLVGTLEYMSPEQARGHPVDARTDVWALGVVLYQSLAGRAPFCGASRSDVLAAILEREPAPLPELNPRVPAELQRIVGKTLRKDPERRYQVMKDLLLDLEALRDQVQAGTRFDSEGASQAAGTRSDVREVEPNPARTFDTGWRRSRTVTTVLLAGALAFAAVTAAAYWMGWRRPATRPAYSLDLVLDGFEVNSGFALSPDGRSLVYRAGGRLWHRALTEFRPTALPDSEGADYPFWSPDSRQVAFVRDQKLWRLPIGDSNAMLVSGAPPGLSGTGSGAWTASGELIIAGSDKVGLFAASLNGGEPREILRLDLNRETDFHQVAALPDGRGLLIAVHRAEGSDTIAALVNGERRVVLQLPGESIQAPAYSPAGYLLFERWTAPSGVWAVRFSIDRLATQGAPFLVVPGGSNPMIGSNGTLAFIRGLPLASQLVSIDRKGSIGAIGELTGQLGQGSGLRVMALSPDESRLAFSIDHPGGTELWSYDLSRRSATRLSAGATRVRSPIWTPNGREVLFGAFGRGRFWNVYSVPAGEAGEPMRALPESAASQWPCSISPDGRWLLYVESRPDGGADLWVAARKEQAPARPLMNTPFRETDAAFSPDGRSIAYVSDESGREEVYVRAFPLTVGRAQVSTEGGSMPAWAPDSQAIFYRSPDALMEVAVTRTADGLSVSPPRQLFTIDPQSRLFDSFVVTSNGGFLFARATGTPYVSVLLNWSPVSATVSP